MKISEHANYLLNEYGRLQFDYAAYYKPYGESLRNEARNNLEEYIAELEALVEGHDPFEDFPPKERGFDCSVMVLGKFEYEDEFTPFTNWDLCVYWFDKEKWHPLNGYVKGDDIVRWYALPYKEREE